MGGCGSGSHLLSVDVAKDVEERRARQRLEHLAHRRVAHAPFTGVEMKRRLSVT